LCAARPAPHLAGNLPPSSEDYPHAPKVAHGRPSKWTPAVAPLRSAYVEATGSEPEFTNHATTRLARTAEVKTFTATLDYIFISPHWEASRCLPTLSRKALAAVKSFPSATEPSDHVAIGCSLSTTA